jgi:hypothetical protein
MLQEKELYNQLRAISDLQFDTLDEKAQEELMRTVVKQDISPGAIIIQEGVDDDGGCFYLILGSPCPEIEARVEVVRNVHGTTRSYPSPSDPLKAPRSSSPRSAPANTSERNSS